MNDDHRFGSSAPLSLGVEEELLLVGPDRHLTPVAARLAERLAAAHPGRVSTEVFAAQIELKTGICACPDEALAELTELRRAAGAEAVALLGSGLHPGDEGKADLVAKPRYALVRDAFASLLDIPTSGLHVHVGMPDPETAIRVANALRRHLPLLEALAANSPFRGGEDTGLASARAAVTRAYPRFEMPREFRDFEQFREVADQLIFAAGVEDYTFLWWDVRPHPRLGTVEVRGMDVQTGVEASVGLAALIQAIAAKEIAEPSGPGPLREALEESSYQANRHGLAARLVAGDRRACPARVLAGAELDAARPYASELGGLEALAAVERIVREGNGADRQRAVHAERGMAGLLDDLVARSRP
ncbi:MAG: YbdK family carboxylate-amine ligase [Solirubrobacterales bacterium]